MQITWLDSNSWLIECSGLRCLIDPWLVGSLTFGDANWLFWQKRKQAIDLPADIDLILLSQGLPDHTHPPTLTAYHQLNPNLEIICSPNCLRPLQQIGFTKITVLDHGKTALFRDSLRITATIGAPIGPLTKENGYILSETATGRSLYYEPHGYPDPQLAQYAPIETAIIPIVDLKIPLLGNIISGKDSALATAQTLQVKHLLPTALGGDLEFGGWLVKILQAEGTIAQLQQQLSDRELPTAIIEPRSWTTFSLDP